MARRNMFQPPRPPAEPGTPAQPAAPSGRSGFPATGAMTAMKTTLRDLSSNAVREIDPAVIEEDGPRDRLAFSDREVADLADSIREHGQQVPIMVRPVAERPGHYRIVYGRRRLRAIRLLGIPAKAMIRTLSDEQAILAQGQENSQRLDPSFIEKALFVGELAAAGYSNPVIMDALAIDKAMLSRMTKVCDHVPAGLAQRIGPAHGIGRRRWEDLAEALRDSGADPDAIASQALDHRPEAGSDDRFLAVFSALRPAAAAPAPSARAASRISDRDGRPLAEIRSTARSVGLKLATAEQPEFSRWFAENAEEILRRLHDEWQEDRDPQA
ncbi:plasmid partitioning protein RepB [Mangrovicoccus algicola]|uniref:Plasmid partitioning protein RepB n=1 Tax=Mangrovicoccus algicola TaxID=2771008 RepID=A0A8J6YWD5_9RHOB|nr:plasmid partitioning protein RepB [Mangrovicoccus algicola]MBE3638842.1 plasmid partitioning protein RepB [Mangrovicoccus algicola]